MAKKSNKMSMFSKIPKVGSWVGGFPKVEIDHMYPSKYQVPAPPGWTTCVYVFEMHDTL